MCTENQASDRARKQITKTCASVISAAMSCLPRHSDLKVCMFTHRPGGRQASSDLSDSIMRARGRQVINRPDIHKRHYNLKTPIPYLTQS